MKKEELKQIIKPLIKECLKEVLIEEGFAKVLSESKEKIEVKNEVKTLPTPVKQEKSASLLEAKKKMLDAIGNTGFDVFAGTEPLKEDSQIVSSNPGIDISKLLENKQVWKQTLNAMNGKKVKE
jgi:hypothetical protein